MLAFVPFFSVCICAIVTTLTMAMPLLTAHTLFQDCQELRIKQPSSTTVGFAHGETPSLEPGSQFAVDAARTWFRSDGASCAVVSAGCCISKSPCLIN